MQDQNSFKFFIEGAFIEALENTYTNFEVFKLAIFEEKYPEIIGNLKDYKNSDELLEEEESPLESVCKILEWFVLNFYSTKILNCLISSLLKHPLANTVEELTKNESDNSFYNLILFMLQKNLKIKEKYFNKIFGRKCDWEKFNKKYKRKNITKIHVKVSIFKILVENDPEIISLLHLKFPFWEKIEGKYLDIEDFGKEFDEEENNLYCKIFKYFFEMK